MKAERNRRSLCTTLFLAAMLFGAPPVLAQYSGGSGTADDPYQIATAADLIALGETPDDYDKHFILTADIDLDPSLPGRKAFAGAVIAPDRNFTGVLSIPPAKPEAWNVNRSKRIAWEPPAAAVNRTSASDPSADPRLPVVECTRGSLSRPVPPSRRSTREPRSAVL